MHPEVEPAAGHQEEGEDSRDQTEAPVLRVTGEEEEREGQGHGHHGVGGGQAELIVPPELHPHRWRHGGAGTSENILQSLQGEQNYQ